MLTISAISTVPHTTSSDGFSAPEASGRGTRQRLTALEDRALLDAVLAGSEAAFAVFFSRFRNLMAACIARVVARAGVRLAADDLSDVLGDVAVNLVAHDYRRLRLYQSDRGCSVSSWVGVIASSTAHDFLRRHRRRRFEVMAEAELERVLPPAEGPDATMLHQEQRAFVDSALAAFSARDREFVELYFLEAMSPEDIAEKMGVSVSTVYSKKAKIKTRLAAMASAA